MADKDLERLVKRRHPEYKSLLPHWEFLEKTYNGGRAWFENNIFKYVKEGNNEYDERLKRAYRFNHTREIADLVNKYLFKAEVERDEKDAPDSVGKFWKRATRNGKNISDFMRMVSLKSSISGRIWIVVDSKPFIDSPLTLADESAESDIYAYIVRPQQVLDLSYDDEDNLNWILIYEVWRDDEDPLESSGAAIDRFRLWTKEDWFLIEARKDDENDEEMHVEIIDEGNHGLGIVPVFKHDHIQDDSLYSSPALIGDIAYLDRAVANYLSNIDAIVQDQTFSQLIMPAQSVLPGEEGYDKIKEMGTKRIIIYDGEHEGARPSYISPDVKQAEIIITIIRQIINEIYHTVGMSGERTKQDNSSGIDNSSGVAKAYDFERVNALLVAKAQSLDRTEEKLVALVKLWSGIQDENEDSRTDYVKYSEDFDIRSLYDELDLSNRLTLLNAPDTMKRQQMLKVVEKMFPMLADDLKEAIKNEIENDWPKEEEPALPKSRDTMMDRAAKDNS